MIKAIAEYGFVNSQYPIVLSIENHCSFEQQKTLAKIMCDVFKDSLAMPLKSSDTPSVLPSPKNLQKRVLIKGKRASDLVEEDDDEDEDDDDDDETAESDSRKSKNEPFPKRAAAGAEAAAPKKAKTSSKIHPDLSAITYLGTGKVKSFSAEVSRAVPCDMMCSYSEGTTTKYMRDEAKVAGWIEHNKSHLRLPHCLLLLSHSLTASAAVASIRRALASTRRITCPRQPGQRATSSWRSTTRRETCPTT